MLRCFIVLFLLFLTAFKAYGEESRFYISGSPATGFSERYISSHNGLDRSAGAGLTGSVRMFRGFYLGVGTDWLYTKINKGVKAGSICEIPNSSCRVFNAQHSVDLKFHIAWRYQLSDNWYFPVIHSGLKNRILISQESRTEIIEQYGISDDRTFSDKNSDPEFQLTAAMLSVGIDRKIAKNWHITFNIEGAYNWGIDYLSRPHTAYKYQILFSAGTSYSW